MLISSPSSSWLVLLSERMECPLEEAYLQLVFVCFSFQRRCVHFQTPIGGLVWILSFGSSRPCSSVGVARYADDVLSASHVLCPGCLELFLRDVYPMDLKFASSGTAAWLDVELSLRLCYNPGPSQSESSLVMGFRCWSSFSLQRNAVASRPPPGYSLS